MEEAQAAKARGNAAFQAGDYAKAVEEFTEAIKHNPKDHVFYSNRSASYANLNEFDKALADADTCIQTKPDWAKGYTRKGLALYKLRKFEDAKLAYSEGLKIDPNNASNKDGVAQCDEALAQSANPMAQLFGESMWGKLAMNPTTRPYLDDPAFVQKLKLLQSNPNMLSSLGNDPKMSQAIGVILGIGSDMGGGGDSGFDPAQDEEMMQKRKEAEEKKKKEEEERLEREEEERKKQQEDAMSPEEKAEKEAKVKAEEIKKAGNDLYKKRKFDEALEQYEEAIKLDPSNLTFQSNRAAVYFEKKEYDTCIEVCQEAIKNMGGSSGYDYKLAGKLWTRIGNAKLRQKNYEEAKEAYEKGLLEDSSPAAKKALRQVENLMKKAAEKAYINPELSMQAKEEGNKLFTEQKWIDAIEKYTEALKRDPSNYKVYSNRAACYTKLMDWQRGLEDCNKCIEMDSTFVKAYIRKGKIQHFLKQYHKALDTYNVALQLDPKCADLLEARQMTMMKINEENASGKVDPARAQEAMKDPEIQAILQDPMMNNVLKKMQNDPASAQSAMADPVIRGKIEKLVAAGILQLG